jgi:hypothetical protein
MDAPTPRVSVIIPAYYSDVTIAACLEALRSESPPPRHSSRSSSYAPGETRSAADGEGVSWPRYQSSSSGSWHGLWVSPRRVASAWCSEVVGHALLHDHNLLRVT